MCNAFTDELDLRGIKKDQISTISKNRSDTKEYLNSRENQYHPYMKVPTLTGTNFEYFDLDFTAVVRIQNDLIGIPLDYLIILYAVGNYNEDWNSHEENPKKLC